MDKPYEYRVFPDKITGSGQHFERRKVWAMVWFTSDQRSLRPGKSDQRRVRSERSDHSLFIVWTMVWIIKRTIVWTIVWVPSDQKLSWSGKSDQRLFCQESLIRGLFGLESLIKGPFSLDSLIIAQIGSGPQTELSSRWLADIWKLSHSVMTQTCCSWHRIVAVWKRQLSSISNVVEY